jgi:hypothetical protein
MDGIFTPLLATKPVPAKSFSKQEKLWFVWRKVFPVGRLVKA